MKATHAPERSGRISRPLLAVLAALSLALAACTGGEAGKGVTPSTPAPPLPSANTLTTTDVSADPIVSVVRKVAPAVVNVTTAVPNPDAFLGGEEIGKGVGTGFVIRSDGIIVTNFHVVEGALNIKVTLPAPDNRSFTARVIGADQDRDLAILKVNGKDLPTVALGDAKDAQLGERVIALGYALALPGGPTVTSGIISSLARTVQASDSQGGTRTYQDALQTDAAINPGNSGGPLVDLAGNVVGINTAGNQQAENVGFAIAVTDSVKALINQAISNPQSALAYLGVSSQTVDAGVAAQFDLAVDHGALVLALAPSGPADRAGIETGDVIVAFGGQPVRTSDDLGTLILERKPQDIVSVDLVRRDGSRETVRVILGVRPLPTG
ncbi:MAG: S1C family serine protease [Actinomycetota bacterium]